MIDIKLYKLERLPLVIKIASNCKQESFGNKTTIDELYSNG